MVVGGGHVAALSATLHHSGGPASSAQRQPLPTGFPFLAPKAFSILAPKKPQNNRLDFPEVKNFLVVVEFIVTVVLFSSRTSQLMTLKVLMFCHNLENLQTAAVCGRRKHANTTLLNVTRN